MFARKGLIIGIVAALGVGALESLGEMAIQQAAAASRAPADPITVPLGSVGDQVRYNRFWKTTETGAWAPQASLAFTVDSVTTVQDRTGQSHPALRIRQAAVAESSEGGLLGREWAKVSNHSRADAYSLSTQDRIASQWNTWAVDRYFFHVADDRHVAASLYGPFPLSRPDTPRVHAAWHLGLHQTRTYSEGMPLPEWAARRLASDDALLWALENGATIQALQGRVGHAAALGGRVALPLILSACVDLPESLPTAQPSLASFFGSLPVPSRACLDYTEWVAADVPYPIRIDLAVRDEAGPTLTAVLEIVKFRPGATPIPWAPGAGPSYRTADPELERSPSPFRRPADGTAYPLRTKLSDALTAVERDPTLTGYQAWRRAHPNALLVGAEGGDGWGLVFGDPDGGAFAVRVLREATSDQLVTQELGAFPTDPFKVEELPLAPPTIAAAHQASLRFGFADRTNQIHVFNWGWWYWAPSIACYGLDPKRCGAIEPYIYPGSWDVLTYAYVPTTALVSSPDQVWVFAPTVTWARARVAVNALDGTVDYTWDYVRQGQPPNLAQASSGLPPPDPVPAAPSGSPDAVTGFNPARPLAVTVGVLALVLLGYFWPLLKSVGASAVLAIPGYAKTTRSRLLEHKLRDTLAASIRADPGIAAPHLQRLTGAGWTTIIYHLRLLEREKLISSLIDGRHRRYFPTDGFAFGARGRVAALRNARTRQLYETLHGSPGLRHAELAKQLGISRPALYWHVERLQRVGLVGADRDGRTTRLYALEETAPAAHGARSPPMEVA